MIVFPAIDLKDGNAVRLEQGDMDRDTVFNDNPADQAKAFSEAGFSWLHVVDLNGAFEGEPVNRATVEQIRKTTPAKMQLGGGIRDMATIEAWLSLGIDRVILGTIAAKDPSFVKQAAKAFPGQVVVGIDARDGFVAVEGWAETSSLASLDLAKAFEDAGVAAIVFTDIARDGMMRGVNLEATVALADAITTPVIASGGLRSIDDVRDLLEHADKGIEGVISGRALYDGRLKADEVLTLLGGANA